MQEMEERMQLMERKYAARLRHEVCPPLSHKAAENSGSFQLRQTEQNELKMDRKIEMLSRTGAFGNPISEDDGECDSDDVHDVEVSLVSSDL